MTPATPDLASAIAVGDLEAVYDRLAASIDAATPDRASLFLVKLALLLARDLNDRPRFEALCATALRDLD